jgi:hypothetical protein
MLLNPMYWKPFWRPIEASFRAILTLLFTVIIWDYCKRLKDREALGFWVDSELDICERKKTVEVITHDQDSSDSLEQESLTLLSTESAGALHFVMLREETYAKERLRAARREAQRLELLNAPPPPTRLEKEIAYVERTRKEEGHKARKELRKRIRLRREKRETEAKAVAKANKGKSPVLNIQSPLDIKNSVKACVEFPDIKSERLKEEKEKEADSALGKASGSGTVHFLHVNKDKDMEGLESRIDSESFLSDLRPASTISSSSTSSSSSSSSSSYSSAASVIKK